MNPKITSSRPRKLLLAAALASVIGWSPTFAADYPSDSIELVVSYAPGGISDLIGRSFAKSVEQSRQYRTHHSPD